MTNKTINQITAFFFSLIVICGCNHKKGSGIIVSENRNTSSFHSLRVSGDFDVVINKGDNENVVIEADDNLIKYIETKVVNGQLRIRTREGNFRNAHFKATITAPYLDDIRASASARITTGVLNSKEKIELHASSAGRITAEIDAPVVNAAASSGGELVLQGRTRNFKASSSSGAEINAGSLLTETSVIKSSSGASANVHASVLLEASASSGASINYTGNANVKKTVSSGADVSKIN